MDDKQLMAQIAAGDQAALQTLLAAARTAAAIYPETHSDRPPGAGECLADISLRLWQRAGDYAPERGAFVPWLTVLARNMALNRARRLRREEPLDETMPHRDGSAEEALLQRTGGTASDGHPVPGPRGTAAVLPEVLLLPIHRPRSPQSWASQSGPPRAAVPPAAETAESVGGGDLL